MRQHHELSVELSGGSHVDYAVDGTASLYSSESSSTQSSSEHNHSHGGPHLVHSSAGPSRLLTRSRAPARSISGSESSSGSSQSSVSFVSDRVPWLDQARQRLVVSTHHPSPWQPSLPSALLPHPYTHHHHRYPLGLQVGRVAEPSQLPSGAPPRPLAVASPQGAGIMPWSAPPAWDRSALTSFSEPPLLSSPQQPQPTPSWRQPQHSANTSKPIPPSLVHSIPAVATSNDVASIPTVPMPVLLSQA